MNEPRSQLEAAARSFALSGVSVVRSDADDSLFLSLCMSVVHKAVPTAVFVLLCVSQ